MGGTLFITGASGFIGQRLLARLDAEEFEDVVCLSASRRPLRGPGAHISNMRVIKGDLKARGRYGSALRAETTVVHLTAHMPFRSRDEFYDTNVAGTKALLDACEKRGIRRFLYVSSIDAAFEEGSVHPYAAAEETVRRSNLTWTVVRPTVVLGDTSLTWKRLSRLSRSSVVLVPGTGQARIQPIYVDDLVDMLLSIVFERIFQREIYDLGGREVLTMGQFLARMHQALYGGEPRLVHVPLRPVRWLLERLEKIAPGRAESWKGELVKFERDSVAKSNPLLERALPRLRDVDGILSDLIAARVAFLESRRLLAKT